MGGKKKPAKKETPKKAAPQPKTKDVVKEKP